MYPEVLRTILSNASAIQMFGFPGRTEYLSRKDAKDPTSSMVSITLGKRFDDPAAASLTPYHVEK